MDQILQTLIKYLLGIIGVGTIVILHEVGHFIAAHFNGIDVEIFSLGFGPKLVGRTFGKTEYRISLILFGGYCRLKGSDDLTRALDIKSKKFKHIESGSLFSVNPINKLFTYLAGPIANIIISILLCSILASLSYPVLSTPCFVAPVTDYPILFNNSTSPSAESGIITGDKVIQIDDIIINDYQDMVNFLSTNNKQLLTFKIERETDGTKTIKNIIINGSKNNNSSYRYGLTNLIPPVIASVRFFSPEYNAGLKKRDKILEINNQSISNNLDLLTILHESKKQPITLKLLRGNRIINISYNQDISKGKRINKFSLYSPTKIIEGKNFNDSIVAGTKNALNLFSNTVKSLILVFKAQSGDVRQVFTGPMRASLMIGEISIMGFENNLASGFRALFYLLAVVSISIAIANLLPLPAFDGGQILIAFLEILFRKKISPSNYWRCQLLGMFCVILIFAFLYFIDLRYFFRINFT